MTIGNDGWGRAGSPSKIIDGLLGKKTYGPELLAQASHETTKMIRLSFSTEMLPSRTDRVQASAKLDNELKLLRPLITFGVDEYSKGGLTAAEAKAPVQPDGTLNWNTAAHIMGTCIMGKAPRIPWWTAGAVVTITRVCSSLDRVCSPRGRRSPCEP